MLKLKLKLKPQGQGAGAAPPPAVTATATATSNQAVNRQLDTTAQALNGDFGPDAQRTMAALSTSTATPPTTLEVIERMRQCTQTSSRELGATANSVREGAGVNANGGKAVYFNSQTQMTKQRAQGEHCKRQLQDTNPTTPPARGRHGGGGSSSSSSSRDSTPTITLSSDSDDELSDDGTSGNS